MKIFSYLLLFIPGVLFAQGKVGINTTNPVHPFQVNVDSTFSTHILDQEHLIMDSHLPLLPGQSVTQGFTITQSGKLSRIEITLGVADAEELLVDIYSGPGPLGGWLGTTSLFDVTGPATYVIEFDQPWPNVTAGQQLNFLLNPFGGTTFDIKSSLGNTYAGGQAHFWNGSWMALGYDLTFKAYVAQPDTASIDVLSVQQNGRIRVKNYLLPELDGAAGQVMATDGDGSISWANPGDLNSGVLSDDDNDTKVEVEAAPDEDIVRFKTAGTERMTILNTGNTGIGTATPANKLSILGSSTSSAPVLKSESTFLGNQHVNAIEGTALPAEGYGKGGHFTGGARGVQAYGEGGASPSMIIGVEGTATGSAGIRVGLFGRAQGGATNWAGYFDDGNVYVKGRTGAGTLLPEAKIHVLENSTTTLPHLRLTETSANDFARIKFETQSDPGMFWDIAARSDSSATNSRINFYYNNPGFSGDKMSILGNGNVGIGTTSPGNRLQVHGGNTSTTTVLYTGTSYTGNAHVRAIEGASKPAIGYGIGGYFSGGHKGVESIGTGESATGEAFGVIGGATGTAGTRIGILGWATGGAVNWAGRFAQGDVWIENNLRTDQNVMIGTTSTTNKLRVHGSTSSTQPVINVTTANTSNVDVIGIQTNIIPATGYGTGGSFTGGRKGILSTASSSTSSLGCTAVDGVATGSAGIKIGIRGNASGAGINWAGYFAQGNVYVEHDLRIGLGAVNGATGYKMAVDGKIIVEEVRVQLSGAWPDYVFQSDYPLIPLDELGKHIREKGHLPGIPKASAIESDGLILGEMQRKMMEKIEELTLYILQQNEEINQMKETIQSLLAKEKN